MPPTSVTLTLPLPSTRLRWMGLGLAIGLTVAAIASPAFAPRAALAADDTAPEHTISVSGTGHVFLSPDVADLRLGVSVTKDTVKAAREAAAERMTRVIDALKKLGIADADIQTNGLSLQPVYDYSTNTNPPKLTGYTLSNGVAVTIRDLDKLGDAIDDSLAAGATSLDGVTFRVDDPAKAQETARKQAMAEAKSIADTLASSAGVSITGVASINETSGPTPYPVYWGAERVAAVAADTSTPIEVGTNELTVTVSVVYLIG